MHAVLLVWSINLLSLRACLRGSLLTGVASDQACERKSEQSSKHVSKRPSKHDREHATEQAGPHTIEQASTRSERAKDQHKNE